MRAMGRLEEERVTQGCVRWGWGSYSSRYSSRSRLHCHVGEGIRHAPQIFAEVSGTVPYHVLLHVYTVKLFATSTSPVEWYKSCAHISFLSEILMCQLNMNMVWCLTMNGTV